jgi:hypothetical protein
VSGYNGRMTESSGYEVYCPRCGMRRVYRDTAVGEFVQRMHDTLPLENHVSSPSPQPSGDLIPLMKEELNWLSDRMGIDLTDDS